MPKRTLLEPAPSEANLIPIVDHASWRPRIGYPATVDAMRCFERVHRNDPAFHGCFVRIGARVLININKLEAAIAAGGQSHVAPKASARKRRVA